VAPNLRADSFTLGIIFITSAIVFEFSHSALKAQLNRGWLRNKLSIFLCVGSILSCCKYLTAYSFSKDLINFVSILSEILALGLNFISIIMSSMPSLPSFSLKYL
jgi:hypothetical protein